jgi:hypothetical protein
MRPFRFGVLGERIRSCEGLLAEARRAETPSYSTLLLRDRFMREPFGDQLAPMAALAAAAARRFVRDLCACWDLLLTEDPNDSTERAWLTEQIDQAVLVASELVTNAVIHAHSQLRLLVELRGQQLHLAGQDADPHLLRLAAAPDPLADGGRGLPLVTALAAG